VMTVDDMENQKKLDNDFSQVDKGILQKSMAKKSELFEIK